MEIIVVLLLIVVAFFTGSAIESRHYALIKKREAHFRDTPAVTFKSLPSERVVRSATLASGSVVISVDHFKRFLATIRSIFGGEIVSYASLIDRGRREAILRMKEAVPDADMFVNCRIETSAISQGQGKSVGCVEILAYGTAIRFET